MIKTVIKHDDEYYYDVIRRNLKRIRIEKKVTQDMLWEMTDLSRQYICDIENKNRNKHITISALGRIADALDIPISKLFEDYWL